MYNTPHVRILLTLLIPLLAYAEDWERFKLHYGSPAKQWEHHALALGNGRMGAMAFGGIENARIQLNEESIWAGPPVPTPTEKYGKAVAADRRQWVETGQIGRSLKAALQSPRYIRCYQPWGDLYLQFENLGDVENYRRELDLDRAVATTRFTSNGVTYTREVFVSAVDDVVIVRQSASKPGNLSFDIRLNRPDDFTTQAKGNDSLVMFGQAKQKEGKNPGVKWSSMLKANVEGGSIRAEGNQLKVTNADTVTLFLSCNTDYNRNNTAQPYSYDLTAKCEKALTAAMDKSYDSILEAHVAEHRKYFRRCTLDLGGKEAAELSTSKRLSSYKDATKNKTKSKDTDFVTLYFQFGRYLLITSSRPGTLPANLQGIWNDKITPPWNCDYHLNINLQMNYWPAEVTNLSEFHEPFFSYIERLIPSGRETARIIYGCEGFAAHHASDVWHWTATQGPRPNWAAWPHGIGWSTTHFMEHYRFTGDKEFLKERAWPITSGAAKFYLGYLLENPRNGKLYAGPDASPENTFAGGGTHSMGPSMSQQIIWDVLTNTLEIAEVLQIENAFVQEVREALSKLYEPRIADDGRLMEWSEPHGETKKELGHRHVSHLYGMHPSAKYNYRETPEFMEACRKSIDYRLEHGGAGVGWSRAWTINFFARFQDAEEAYNNVHELFAGRSTTFNLFDLHNRPFQIDGNFGGTAGIAEMLLQSHAGEIALLPALPEAWPEGKATGFRTRGNAEVDLEWFDGKLVSITLKADQNYKSMPIRYKGKIITPKLNSGQTRTYYAKDFK
ncbi:MAG: glycoside hydrolase family 95 protein [Verrucomicrobiota bacterium]